MANKYRYMSAVGQLDPMACWAACLKWWLKAVKSVNKSQKGLIGKYNHLTDEFGGMPDSAIQHIITDNGMLREAFFNASDFTVDAIKARLAYSPIYTAYTETPTNKKHVNVIYDVSGTGSSARVWTMEPEFETNDDFTAKGKHLQKPLSDFNALGTVYIGSTMPSLWDPVSGWFD